uniref:Caspase n=2 Tax=Solanum tuberosum TaxID=4113 RepID=M1AXU7_SOLTU
MGALTYSFIQTLEQETKLTYGRLIMSMQNKIQQAQKGLGLNGANETQVRFYKCTIGPLHHHHACLMHFIGLAQEPQLSSSEPFDIHSKLVAI